MDKINRVIYSSQSQSLLVKTNEDRTTSRKGLLTNLDVIIQWLKKYDQAERKYTHRFKIERVHVCVQVFPNYNNTYEPFLMVILGNWEHAPLQPWGTLVQLRYAIESLL